MFRRSSWGYLLLIASSVAIFIATISPFNFVITDSFSENIIIDSFHGSTNIKDYVRNILLFVCFGLACAKILTNKKYRLDKILTLCFLLSAIFSLSIELTQILLPSRISSFSDIICNSLGGLLGGSIYCWRKDFARLIYSVINRDYRQINLQFLAAIIVSYIATIICSWALLINSINLSNWSKDAYLAIASEVTGQIFWRGSIASLYICDRAIDRSEIDRAFKSTNSFFSRSPNLVTSFLFSEVRPFYSDKKAGTPDLHWQQQSPYRSSSYSSNNLIENVKATTIDRQAHNYNSVLFERKNSLISVAPATDLNQRIRTAQEFTLSIILATNKLKQVGPSRIVSLGENIYHRNLMLGQEDSNLVFYFRTPITGERATQPGFYIPNFFQDTNFHQILITFSDRQITFYVDNPSRQYNFIFQPSTLLKLFLPLLVEQWNINLASFDLLKAKIVFRSFVLIPMAGLIYIFVRRCTVKIR